MRDSGALPSRWLRLLRWFGLARRARVYAADTVIVDMSEAIQLLDPDPSQFQTMLWSLQNRQLDSTRLINNAIAWLEDDLMLPRVHVDLYWADWGWVG